MSVFLQLVKDVMLEFDSSKVNSMFEYATELNLCGCRYSSAKADFVGALIKEVAVDTTCEMHHVQVRIEDYIRWKLLSLSDSSTGDIYESIKLPENCPARQRHVMSILNKVIDIMVLSKYTSALPKYAITNETENAVQNGNPSHCGII